MGKAIIIITLFVTSCVGIYHSQWWKSEWARFFSLMIFTCLACLTFLVFMVTSFDVAYLVVWAFGSLSLGFSYFSIWMILQKDNPKLNLWIVVIPLLFMAYCMIALTFCILYFHAEELDRFAFVNAKEEGDFLYFSLIVQGTVGFGDIYPKSAHARTLVCVHEIVGHLFNLVVFGVVGAQVAKSFLEKPELPADERDSINAAAAAAALAKIEAELGTRSIGSDV